MEENTEADELEWQATLQDQLLNPEGETEEERNAFKEQALENF